MIFVHVRALDALFCCCKMRPLQIMDFGDPLGSSNMFVQEILQRCFLNLLHIYSKDLKSLVYSPNFTVVAIPVIMQCFAESRTEGTLRTSSATPASSATAAPNPFRRLHRTRFRIWFRTVQGHPPSVVCTLIAQTQNVSHAAQQREKG